MMENEDRMNGWRREKERKREGRNMYVFFGFDFKIQDRDGKACGWEMPTFLFTLSQTFT